MDMFTFVIHAEGLYSLSIKIKLNVFGEESERKETKAKPKETVLNSFRRLSLSKIVSSFN